MCNSACVDQGMLNRQVVRRVREGVNSLNKVMAVVVVSSNVVMFEGHAVRTGRQV